jgi:hypothetical protein
MRLNANGDLEVSLGETVTMEIVATDTAFLAHTGAIRQGSWGSVKRTSAKNEISEFAVSAAFSHNFFFVVGFDFSLGPAGTILPTAQYILTIRGTGPGGFVRSRTILPISILPTSRVFSFEVGQG